MSGIGKEIRLDLIVDGKKKTFTQDFVPFMKALDYTEQESKLFEKYKGQKDENGKEKTPSTLELAKFRADFVSGLFDDPDLTGEVILNGLDTQNQGIIMDIIFYRLMGYTKQSEVEVDPKAKKKV